MPDKRLIDGFVSMFTQQSGTPHETSSVEEAAKIVNEVVKRESKGRVCCAPFTIHGRRFDTLVESVYPLEKISEGDALTEIGSLDIGITFAAGAISQTGSLVEISNSDDERLLSSLSRIHVAIVEAKNIRENLSDFAPLIRSHLSSPAAKPNITFIGGPSRTSDIELKSVLGVHGPHEVHAVILSE